RLSRSIHKGLRLQQQPTLASDRAIRELAPEPAAKGGKAVPPGDRVDRYESDVVAVSSIASTRVAEADDETHHDPIGDAAKLGGEVSAHGKGVGPGKARGSGSFLANRR